MTIWFQSPAMCRVTNQQTRLPRATSSLALNASRVWGIHSLLGQPVQCVTTLWVKNFLLISNLNLPCLSLKPFPLVLSNEPLLGSILSSLAPNFWGVQQIVPREMFAIALTDTSDHKAVIIVFGFFFQLT